MIPSDKKRLQRIIIFLLVCVNLCIFIYAVSRPIVWQQAEMAFERFYWSVDFSSSSHDLLRTGFHADDLQKLFSVFRIDAGFRTRQFSYLVEMSFFKLWQYLGIVSFQDFTLIFLHIVNTFLFGFVVYFLTKQKNIAILCGALFLNSGIAQATLFFPFRSAKLLTVALFLAAWLCALSSKEKFSTLSSIRKYTIGILFFLAAFTDEIFIFLFPLILLYAVIKDGWKEILRRGFLIKTSFLLVLIGITVFMFHNIAISIDPTITVAEQQKHFSYLWNALHSWDILTNTCEAFSSYFLRTLLGAWDMSVMGGVSVVASIGLVFFCFDKNKKKEVNILSLCILSLIFIRAFLLPNSYGMQEFIMPSHATFASFLYYTYYYTYPDAVLIILVLALQLNKTFLNKPLNFIFALILISAIQLSNVLHMRQNIDSTLKFHSEYFTNQNIIPAVLDLARKSSMLKGEPVYLSFPSGSKDRFARIGKKTLGSVDLDAYTSPLLMDYFNYETIIPTRFLKTIEEGKMIISSDNILSLLGQNNQNELQRARYFFNVPKGEVYDLNAIVAAHGEESLTEHTTKDDVFQMAIPLNNTKKAYVCFFVKGGAYITLNNSSSSVKYIQDFGQAYQMFIVDNEMLYGLEPITFRVTPMFVNKSVSIIGPFMIDRIFNAQFKVKFHRSNHLMSYLKIFN